jgi:hypothetical protein
VCPMTATAPSPATATAVIPSGPVEAYAQASAEAVPPGAPTSSQVSAVSASARMTGEGRFFWGACTTEIMDRGAPGHAEVSWIGHELGTSGPRWLTCAAGRRRSSSNA